MSIRHVAKYDNNEITFEIFDERKTLDRICGNRALGYFVAETCARYMNPYVPMRTGMLAQNYTVDPFMITYDMPYAHRMYYGEDFDFNTEMHPNACAKWNEPMEKAKKKQIAKEITMYLGRS